MSRTLLASSIVCGALALLTAAPAAQAAEVPPKCAGVGAALHMSSLPQTIHLSCTDKNGDHMRLGVVPPLLGSVQNFVDHGDGTGTVQYVAPPFFTGPVTFTYYATDGLLTSLPANIQLFFTDQRPSCGDVRNVQTHHLRSVTITLPCADPDHDPLSYSIMTPPVADKGTAKVLGNGQVTFTPNPAYTGTAYFKVKASDGAGTDGSNVYVSVTNRAPSCNVPARLVIPNDRASTITLSCSDPDGDPLSLVTDAAPAYGTLGAVTHLGGTFSLTYTPQPGYVGDDRIVFRAADGVARAPELVVPVTVTPPGGAVETSVHSDASDILDRLKLARITFAKGLLRLHTLRGVGAGSRLKVKLTKHGRSFGRRTISVHRGPTPVSVRLSRAGRRWTAHHKVVNVRLSLTLVSPAGGSVNDWRILRLIRHGRHWVVR